MKRVILSVPAGISFDALTPEQQAAIQGVFGQFVLPMPGTIPAAGRVLCDAVTSDAFDPANMPALGLDWPIVGLWQWGGAGDLVELQPFDTATFLTHLPDVVTYDEAGAVLEVLPPVLHESHRWSGWPQAF